MKSEAVRCVLLADRHHGLTEGIRGLLETSFDAVVMVADETSFLESAERLRPTVVVADLALAPGESFGWLRRLLARCPKSRVIVLSNYDELTVARAALEAGAAGAEGSKGPGMAVGGAAWLITGSLVGLHRWWRHEKFYGEASGNSSVEGRAKATAKEIADQFKKRFEEEGWIN